MSFRRVVVALDTSSSLATLATAIGLARAMEAELVGLFIEDSDLIAFAALPFAGEVGFPSALRRTLDVGTMERSLRAQAREIEKRLRERLAGAPHKWTFEVVRGSTFSVLASVVAERDLAVVSVRRNAIRARADIRRAIGILSTPLLIVTETQHRMIAVVGPPDAAPADIANLIVALSAYYGRSALFVTAQAERPHWRSWWRDVDTLLSEHAISVRFRVVASATRGELDRIVAEERPRLIVALAHVPALRDVLIDSLPYPLLVLPPAHPQKDVR